MIQEPGGVILARRQAPIAGGLLVCRKAEQEDALGAIDSGWQELHVGCMFVCRGWGEIMHGFVNEFAEGVFTPETIEVLTAAFDEAWRKVTSSNAPWAQPDYTKAARTIIARHIIAAAKFGETDRQALADGALLHLSRQKLSRALPE